MAGDPIDIENSGSDWWFPVREGLIVGKHVKNMGPAIVLYLFCLKYATVARQGGLFLYNHIEASNQLDQPIRTIKRWFYRLQENGYLITSGRRRHSLQVQVAKFHPVEEMMEADHMKLPRGPTDDTKASATSSATSSATTSAKICKPLLTIDLKSYTYPTGSTEHSISMVDAFRGLMDILKTSKNKSAVLRQIYQLCFGGDQDSLPAFGYLGKVARQVGGAGRLAELMWQLTTKPPTGDVLAYIQAANKNKGKPQPIKVDTAAIARQDAAMSATLEKASAKKENDQ